ncbi:MAG: 1-phosphofructokinase family hexose kinase [Bdellovibrionia bacterium]
MIYSFTPNPCLDLSGSVSSLIPNEKAYVHHESRHPGGNAINAARIAHRWGAPVLVSGFLGGGSGREVKQLLKTEGVKTQFIPIQGFTRINVTVSNERNRQQTRLSFPGPKILPQEKTQLRRFLEKTKPNSLLILGGSLPPQFTGQDLKAMIQWAYERKNTPTLVDVPGTTLKHALTAGCLLMKPNLTEFQQFLRTSAQSVSEVFKRAQPLTRKIPLICISSVEGGALLVTAQGSFFGKPPKISVKTTLGAGDSMVGTLAALLWTESQKNRCSIDELIRTPPRDFMPFLLQQALAAACGTLTLPGLELTHLKQIRRYSPQIQVRTLA